MATGIYFNGRTTYTPGSYTEVDASGLARVALGATGIIGMIGEAEGGAPYTTTDADDVTVHPITNPSKVAKTFRSGDLLEAGTIAFNPSKDPLIPGGAQEIKFAKVNPATQSTYTFTNVDGNALVVTSRNYGLFTTQVSVDFSAGTNSGKAITVVFEDQTESWDDIGGDVIFTAHYNSVLADNADTMTLAVHNVNGVTALWTKTHTGQFDDYDGNMAVGTGLDSDADNAITSGTATIVSSDAGDTTQSIIVYGISGGVAASETIALNGADGTTPVAGATSWTEVHAVVKSAVTVGNITVTSTVGGLTMFVLDTPANLYTGGGFRAFSESIEIAGEVLNIVADGAEATDCIIVGTNESDVAQLEEVTLNGTTMVPTTGSWNSVSGVAVGLVAAARTLTLSGRIFDTGDVVTLVSDAAGDTGTAVIYGLDGGGLAQTETLTMTGTGPVNGTATWSEVHGIDVSAAGAAGAAPAGSITASAATGSVSIGVFTSAINGISDLDDVLGGGAAVTVVSDAAADDQDILIIGTAVGGAAQVENLTLNGVTPVVGTALWESVTGMAILHVANGSTLTLSGTAFALTVASYPTLGEVVAYIEPLSGWVASEVAGDAGAFLVAEMDNAAAADVTSLLSFYAELQRIVDILTNESILVKATRSAAATGTPDNTAVPVFLVGGIEGVTGFANWQAALDLLRDERCNTIVVLSTDAAVHAAVVAHCVYMAGAGRSERDCILGEASAATLAALQTAARNLNTRHARLAIQDIEVFNTSGVREQFDPSFTAALAAGMQSGSSVGESLTFKFLNVLDIVGNDTSYTVQDDSDALIQAGLLAIQKVPNVGFRWLRNITTYLIDDNLAYTEGSVNEAVNFATFEFRQRMETAVGKKGFAGTLNAAMAVAIGILGQLVTEEVITNWQNLVLELTDDVMSVDVEIAPIIPVNFVQSTLHLVSSTLSLTA